MNGNKEQDSTGTPPKMNENRLGDYRRSEAAAQDENNGPGLGGSLYQQEANTLKIEKLSHRVTIISVIIPCIIIAILAFVYLDIREKVDKKDQTQADKMARVTKDLEIKLNALDVRIARATHDLDQKLDAIETKRQALENQTAKMSASKVDLKAMETALKKLDQRIKTNAEQDKSTLASMERINKQLGTAIDKNNAGLKKAAGEITEEVQQLKDKIDARLLELVVYEQKINNIVQETSRLDKEIATLKQETAAAYNEKLIQLKQELENRITAVQKKADVASAAAVKAEKTAAAALTRPAAATGTAQPAASSAAKSSSAKPSTGKASEPGTAAAPSPEKAGSETKPVPTYQPPLPAENSSDISEQTLLQ